MANSRAGNVIFVDTTAATYTGAFRVKGVKYIGNTNGTLQIQKTDSSGKVLWQGSGSTDQYDQAEFFSPNGLYVALTNGAKAYIYLE